MKKYFNLVLLFVVIAACANSNENEATHNAVPQNEYEDQFSFVGPEQDTLIQNGEEITRHKSGAIYLQGMMKNGQRDGLWKSFYENGTPWSETTFKDGIKNGKTVTYYPNGYKRYEGYYTNDIESGNWLFYNEHGQLIKQQDFDKKK